MANNDEAIKLQYEAAIMKEAKKSLALFWIYLSGAIFFTITCILLLLIATIDASYIKAVTSGFLAIACSAWALAERRKPKLLDAYSKLSQREKL